MHCSPWYRNLTSLAMSLALMTFASVAQAQTNACYENGTVKGGTLEATLNGTMTTSGNNLDITLPDHAPNTWSIRNTDRPNSYVQDEVVNKDAAIVVPATKAALMWLQIDTSTAPTAFRVGSNPEVTLNSSYQAVPGVSSLLVKGYGTDIMICDNNTSSTTHTWNFAVKIGNTWYDPQVKNLGTGG